MSDVSNRNWVFWINKNAFDSKNKYYGTFECLLIPSLMAQQTVDFLESGYQIGIKSITENKGVASIDSRLYLSEIDGAFCLKIHDWLDTTIPIEKIVADIISTLEAISICVDFPIVCNSIRFVWKGAKQIFAAKRQPLGRAMAFEVEERICAQAKLQEDFTNLLSCPKSLEVAIKHYLTGMTLLGLEDQISGFTDASFMQFYQGFEAICECGSGNITDMLKSIAKMDSEDSRSLQIIAHQVIQVRHHYFGHGDVKKNYRAIENYEVAMQATKQVLVARYLCKRLIDIHSISQKGLIREMGFYPRGYSESFNGDVELLNTSFRVPFQGRTVTLFDNTGKECSSYQIG
jgi:hypothetical protein